MRLISSEEKNIVAGGFCQCVVDGFSRIFPKIEDFHECYATCCGGEVSPRTRSALGYYNGDRFVCQTKSPRIFTITELKDQRDNEYNAAMNSDPNMAWQFLS